MDKKGMLVVISGFSGVGKGTVSRALVEKYGYSLSVSATTRQPRKGEVDGKDYYFKSEEDFLRLIDYNGFIEYAQYVEHYYGTPRKFVEDELAAGHVVILEIEVQGADHRVALFLQEIRQGNRFARVDKLDVCDIETVSVEKEKDFRIKY